MAKVTYVIVRHENGWAYKVGDVFSETFPTREAAHAAAERAAEEQRVGGQTTGIEWEDASGKWHGEVSQGGDRPSTEVKD